MFYIFLLPCTLLVQQTNHLMISCGCRAALIGWMTLMVGSLRRSFVIIIITVITDYYPALPCPSPRATVGHFVFRVVSLEKNINSDSPTSASRTGRNSTPAPSVVNIFAARRVKQKCFSSSFACVCHGQK